MQAGLAAKMAEFAAVDLVSALTVQTCGVPWRQSCEVLRAVHVPWLQQAALIS